MDHPEYDRQFTDLWPKLFNYAMLFCHNEPDASDLVSDVYVRGRDNLHRLRDGGKLAGWLVIMMRNSHYSGFKRPDYKLRVPMVEVSYQDRDIDDPEEAIRAPNPLDALARHIHQATPGRRATALVMLLTGNVRERMAKLLRVDKERVGRRVQDFKDWVKKKARDFPRDDEHPVGWMRQPLEEANIEFGFLPEKRFPRFDDPPEVGEDWSAKNQQERDLYESVASRLGVNWWSVLMYLQASPLLTFLDKDLPAEADCMNPFDHVHIPKELDHGLFSSWSHDLRMAATPDRRWSSYIEPEHGPVSPELKRTCSLSYAWKSLKAMSSLKAIPTGDHLSRVVVNSAGTFTLRRIIKQILAGHADEWSLWGILGCDW